MRAVVFIIIIILTFSGSLSAAQEPPNVQCQDLAKQFSENPDSLAIQALERLRYCVNQTLEHRERSLKGELLKGTIIEPPSFSEPFSDDNSSTIPKRQETLP